MKLPLLCLILLEAASGIQASGPIVWNPFFPTKLREEKVRGGRRGSYLVVGPQVVRPGLPYAVSVNLFRKGLGSLDVRENTVTLELKERYTRTTNPTKALTWVRNIQPDEPITIPILANVTATLNPGTSYTVAVKGTTKNGQLIFQGDGYISVVGKPLAPFVQTDKALYKPQSTVRFRTLVVNPELRALAGNVTVKVKDPKQNVIKLYLNQTLTNGVLSRQFDLSSQPPLGEWSIQVLQDNHKQLITKTFTVSKYVLPKFDVKIESPDFIQIPEDVSVTVKAKYTYGKGIAGKVTVTPRTPSNPAGPIQKTATLDQDGEARVTFSFPELFRRNLIQGYGTTYSIPFHASVVEDLTKAVRNATGTVTLYQHGVTIVFAKNSPTFKPGLEFELKMSVLTPNLEPIPPHFSRTLRLHIKYTMKDGLPNTEERRNVTLGAEGITETIKFLPPPNAVLLTIDAFYHRNPKNSGYEYAQSLHVFAMKSASGQFIQVKPKFGSSTLVPGEEARFQLSATEPLRSATIQVLSGGRVVLSQEVAVGGSEGEVSFLVSADMAPSSRLILYALRPQNAEILVDVVDFTVEGFFKNKVWVNFSRTSTGPGERVEVRGRADPHSLFCLMAVDQSVRLLKSGFDITPSMVESSVIHRVGHSGGDNAQAVFSNANLMVITNAWLYNGVEPTVAEKEEEMEYDGGDDDDAGEVRAEVAPSASLASFAAGPPPPQAARRGRPQPVARGRGPQREKAKKKKGAGADTAPRPPSQAKVERVRTKFPETWIWTDQYTDDNGEMVHSAEVPDTITSWVGSAFAVHPQTGLGIAKQQPKLTVFQPFFATLNLPYSIKRLEKLALQVIIFNYDNIDHTVTVRLEWKEGVGFEFVREEGGEMGKITKETSIAFSRDDTPLNIRRLNVPKGSGKSVFFPIVGTKVGKIPLYVTATSATAADALRKSLRVEPEGFPVEQNMPQMIELSSSNRAPFKQSLTMDFPPQIVEGSEWAQVSVIGDVMGPSLQNVDDLVRMPYGCGEQNMVNFVPTIVVNRYLEATERLTPSLRCDMTMDDMFRKRAVEYMESGYQRQLSYLRYDNSFSAFGNSDIQGSTWLTAFVLKSFRQATPYIYVDQDVLTRCIAFLRQKQNSPNSPNPGAFQELGHVHNKALQGGSKKAGVPLTAYVMIALLENEMNNNEAVRYVEENLAEVANDSYALSIATFALHLANSSKADSAFTLLDKRAVETNGMKHWNQTEEEKVVRPWYWHRPRTLDVEATAYALLTYLKRGMVLEGASVVRWLVSQQNSNGGYSSTQDTVMALQALGAYAEKVYSSNTNLQISIRNGKEEHSFFVVPENAIVLQQYELKHFNQTVVMETIGMGVAFVQVSWRYHLKPSAEDPEPFLCTPTLTQLPGSTLNLNVCCRYNRKNSSNMAVVEVVALSGYTMDGDELEGLTSIPDLQRVELEKSDTKALLYFNQLDKSPVCFDIKSEQTFSVVEQKPGRIVVYDYYDPQLRTETTYSLKDTGSLNQKCPECWSNVPKKAELIMTS